MVTIDSEIESNFNRFLLDLSSTFESNRSAILANHKQVFLESYARIASLNAWRSHIFESKVDRKSSIFFLEAQNDALISHINAQSGLWRSALQSLRSCLENTLLSLYYKDHLVELDLWERNKFRISFTELREYFNKHPNFHAASDITGLSLLKNEYQMLSQAVHGSSPEVRMTDGDEIVISSIDIAKLGQWNQREKKVIQAINCILVAEFHEHLRGASNRFLRKSISLCLRERQKIGLNESYRINIPLNLEEVT